MIKEKLREILKEAGTGNVMRIKCGSSASQQFENIMVHLTALAAAKIFLEVMTTFLELLSWKFWEAF
jgi:hypothetical protein